MKKLVLLSGILAVIGATAQDVHFSLYDYQPLYTNVGMAGDFEGDIRFAAISRRQWGQLGTPINSTAASLEKKVQLTSDFLVLGGQFINDQISISGLLTSKAYFSSTLLKSAGKHSMHVGMQVGYVQTQLDPNQTFPTQFNSATGTFDSSIDSGELGLNETRGFLDLNIGGIWVYTHRNKHTFKTGLAVAHVNRPNASYLNSTEILPFRYTIHHTIESRVSSGWTIIPQAQITYSGGAKESVVMLKTRRQVSENFSLLGGLGYRGYIVQSDAAVGIIGMSYGYLDIAASYDLNISGLSTNSTQKTSYEIALVLRSPKRKYKPVIKGTGVDCPEPQNTTLKKKKKKS